MLPLSHSTTSTSKVKLFLWFIVFVTLDTATILASLVAVNYIYFGVAGKYLFTLTWELVLSISFLAQVFGLFKITLKYKDW
jgi:hypothetical protein